MHGDIGNQEQKCLGGAGRRWSAQGRIKKSRLGGTACAWYRHGVTDQMHGDSVGVKAEGDGRVGNPECAMMSANGTRGCQKSMHRSA